MDLTAGGIIDVRGWLGKVGKTCMKWQLNGSENQKSSFKFDSWSMGGERWVLRNKAGSPTLSAEARWVWTLSTRSDFLFKLFSVTTWRLDDSGGLRNCRKEVFFWGGVWQKVHNKKELQCQEKLQNTCWASTWRANSSLAPSPESIRWYSACAVKMSQQISFLFVFSPVDALSCLVVAEN